MSFVRALLALFNKKKPNKKSNLPSPAAYFDPSYYLAAYGDVAAAKMDPWYHFYHHGYAEGRWPAQLQAVEAERLLWAESSVKQAEQLLLALTHAENPAERSAAAWLLGRWYAASKHWSNVIELMPFFMATAHPVPGHLTPRVLWLEALRHGDFSQGQDYLLNLQKQYAHHVDVALMTMNYAAAFKNQEQWWQPLNNMYGLQGLASLRFSDEQRFLEFDRLSSQVDSSETCQSNEAAVVSVILPTYNAEKTIGTALRGLTAQSWQNLEILVVDDASTDQTLALVEKWSQQDSRIRIIKQPINQGAYITRNVGLSHSTGDYITVHDSDDWSHPQKIEQQLLPLLENDQLKATLSHWVRVTDDLVFGSWAGPEDWNGMVHRNVSSLLMRRQVFKELGYWDSVVCSADTEYYYRTIAAYGGQALQEVQPGIPLAFGRVRADSLTQRSETHIFSIFSGLRHDYKEAYQNWHTHCSSKGQLYMPQYPETRPFVIDAKMQPLSKPLKERGIA